MKVYGVFNMDQCYKMMLGQPILKETFTSREEAEKRAKELSNDEHTNYYAADSHFHTNIYHSKEEFIDNVKKARGFLYLSTNLGNDLHQMVVVYNKNVICPKLYPEFEVGCVAVSEHYYEASRYEVREIEVKE